MKERERERREKDGGEGPFHFFFFSGPLIEGLTPAGPLLSRRSIWLLRPLLGLLSGSFTLPRERESFDATTEEAKEKKVVVIFDSGGVTVLF